MTTQSFRLSSNQWGMVFLDRLAPGSSLYNVPWVVRVDGAFDPEVFRRALRLVVRRQAALRTTFDLSGLAAGRSPQQVVRSDADFEMRILDWSGADSTLRALAAEPFDLERGPLLRVAVLRRGDTEHHLLFNVHHLVFDGFSIGILLRDLAAAYRMVGTDRDLPALPVSYGEFAERQFAAMAEVRRRQVDYWRTALAGAPGVIRLPADRPRPPTQSFRGEDLDLPLPRTLREELAGTARRHRVSLFMLLVAAWQAQLHRYSGQSPVLVGCPVGARTTAGTDQAIGYFINMTVLATEVSAEASFAELLGRVRGTVLGALTHQDLPFDEVVDALDPPRSLAHNPLFQVLFAFEEDVTGDVELPGLRLGPVRGIATGGAKFDLTLTVRDLGDRFELNIEYVRDLFDAATVRRIGDDYAAVLAHVAAHPEAVIGDLPVRLRATGREAVAPAVEAGVPYLPPRTDLERDLAALWRELLSVDRVGVRDDFFRLGGNSLSATRLIARLATDFGADVPVRALFEGPTVAELAAAVAQARPVAPEVDTGQRMRLSDLLANPGGTR